MRCVWLVSVLLLACGRPGPSPVPVPVDTDDLDTDVGGEPELSVAIEPEAPLTADALRVTWSVVPPVQGDWSIRWSRDGEPVAALDDAEQVPDELTAKGQRWSVEVRVASGVVAPTQASVQIGDTPPVVVAASISPLAPVQGSEMSVVDLQTFDADGDEVDVEVAWWMDGVEVADGDTWVVAAPRGAAIVASITPRAAGLEGPAFQTTAVHVVNTPPVATDARVEPEAPTALDDLTAAVTLTDVDGDAVTATYTWMVDGVMVQQGSSPVLYGGGFAGLAAGSFHSCGWRDDGVVVCWGRNTEGQASPLPVPMSGLSAGGRHSCGLNEAGALVCWGANDFAQSTPPTGSFSAVAAGFEHSCALATDGQIVCWGRNQHAQLGAPAGAFAHLALGAFHGCAIADGGDLWCWGRDDAGQASPPDGRFVAVEAGTDRSCALREDGAVVCWGAGPSAPDGGFRELAVGGSQACARTDAGEVLCWGSNSHGQLDARSDVETRLAVGGFHACGLDVARRPVCWGRDEDGQATVAAGAFRRGAMVSVAVVPSDGLAVGAEVSSAQIEVGNAPPVVRELGLHPAPPTALSGVAATLDAFDPDGDSLTTTFRWSLDASEVQVGPNEVLTEALNRDQLLLLEAEVSDGIASAHDAVSVVVANSPPVAAIVGSSPSPARTGADVTCTAEASDADGDGVALAWSWIRNEAPVPHVSTDTFPSASLEAGDVLRCVVTPSDGQISGAAAESGAIQVVNGPPVVEGIALSPEAPTRRDVAEATPVGASDPDGDAITFAYVWRLGDALVGSEAALDLAPFPRGSVLTVTVTPSDGLSPVEPTPVQASVTVANSPPVVGVSLPPAPTRAAPIHAAVTVDDPDDDTPALTYAWAVAGEPVADADTHTLDVANFFKGQEVAVVVTADDGHGGSDAADASTVVQNAVPSVPTVQLIPALPVAGRDDLRCAVEVASEDPDPEDVVNYTMSWTVDGADFGGAGTVTWPGDFVPVDVPEAGQLWACAAVATDGTASVGSNVSAVEVVEPDAIGGVSAGDQFSCAVRTDGSAVCWGRDDHGQALPPSDVQLLAVSAGYRHACGLDLTGSAVCWGDPSEGRTTQIVGTFDMISAGGPGTCALTEGGALMCWGEASLTGVPVGTFLTVDVGGLGACALRDNGSAVCWGDAGLEDVAPGSFVALAVGHAHACGLRANGAVVCWGSGHAAPPSGAFDALGAGGTATCGLTGLGEITCWGDPNIAANPASTARVSDLTVGRTHACSWTGEGGVQCWGDRRFGAGVAPQERVTQVAVGEHFVCGLQVNGRNLCFGEGPAAEAPSQTFTIIDAGRRHACGRRANGQLTCWGEAEFGQLSAPGGTYSGLGVGEHHACAIGFGDMMSCWGRDNEGQASPPSIIGITLAYVDVAGGALHTCALRTNRNLRCWGSNAGGVSNPPGGNYSAVSASSTQSCAIRSDGVTVCWGSGVSAPGASFTSITGSAHSARMCGRTSAGQVICWGSGVAEEPPADAPPFTSVGTGGATCAVDVDGGLWCWDGLRRAPL